MSLIENNNENPILPVFRRIGQGLQRMARTMLGNEEDAEDTLQDAFCRLWQRRNEIRSESEAKALLTVTVRNLSIDALRHRKTMELSPIDEQPDDLPDEAETLSEREEKFRKVEELINEQLSPLSREILRRKEYEGESIDAIAASLDMQPTAVRMHLSRARKHIKACYLKQEES